MEEQVKNYFEDLEANDKGVQYEAYTHLLALTEKEVDWAYEVWDHLLEDLSSRYNHKRSRARHNFSRIWQ